jgi:putative DNA methylase
MTSPVMAVKTISVKSWAHKCPSCETAFEIEESDARMAPDVPLYVSPDEPPFVILSVGGEVVCPGCDAVFTAHVHPVTGLSIETGRGQLRLGKGKNKKVELTLLVHPEWLSGSPKTNQDGEPYGGSPRDNATATAAWNLERARHIRLLEVRGSLPDQVECPTTGLRFSTGQDTGSVPKQGHFTCRACGTMKDQLSSFSITGKSGPTAVTQFKDSHLHGQKMELLITGDSLLRLHRILLSSTMLL